jgi:hypothetical protein
LVAGRIARAWQKRAMRSTILLALLACLGACAAPTNEEADESAEPTESSESDLSAANLVGKRYAVTGTFVIRDVPSMADRDPKRTVLGDGGAEITLTRAFDGSVSGFIGNHHDKFAADVRIVYRTASGAKRVVSAADRDFEPEARGYGPFVDVVTVGNVSLGVVVSDFGRRRMFQAEITAPAPNGKEILFLPKTMAGPF